MKQRLIVEGNDAIVLANICKKRNLSPPAGYASPDRFIKEFLVVAGGYDKAVAAFKQALQNATFDHLGIILDTNQTGAAARWQTLKNILKNIFPSETLDAASPSPNGIVLKAENLPTVGIWLMPDNQSNGYLEHFLAGLIPAEDEVWQFANVTVDELMRKDFCKFAGIRKQKALVHTWLAWQESPGMPFGTAAQAGYFDVDAPVVQPFLDWFRKTFVLE